VLSPFSPSRTGGGRASLSEDPIIDQDYDVNVAPPVVDPVPSSTVNPVDPSIVVPMVQPVVPPIVVPVVQPVVPPIVVPVVQPVVPPTIVPVVRPVVQPFVHPLPSQSSSSSNVVFQNNLPFHELPPLSSLNISNRIQTPGDDSSELSSESEKSESPSKRIRREKRFNECVSRAVNRILLTNPPTLNASTLSFVPDSRISPAIQKFTAFVNSVPSPVDRSFWFAASTATKEVMSPEKNPSYFLNLIMTQLLTLNMLVPVLLVGEDSIADPNVNIVTVFQVISVAPFIFQNVQGMESDLFPDKIVIVDPAKCPDIFVFNRFFIDQLPQEHRACFPEKIEYAEEESPRVPLMLPSQHVSSSFAIRQQMEMSSSQGGSSSSQALPSTLSNRDVENQRKCAGLIRLCNGNMSLVHTILGPTNSLEGTYLHQFVCKQLCDKGLSRHTKLPVMTIKGALAKFLTMSWSSKFQFGTFDKCDEGIHPCYFLPHPDKKFTLQSFSKEGGFSQFGTALFTAHEMLSAIFDGKIGSANFD
jgi:hypothetical protein